MIDFSGENVLVTGGSRGIGRTVVETFAALGARVAVHYHRKEAAALEVVSNLAGEGHFAVQADVKDAAMVASMVDAVVERCGRVHMLVNNAGIYEEQPLAAVDYEAWQASWQQVLGTNIVGAANVTYCVARHMIEAGGGRIVNVSSRGAFRGEPDAPAYGASKAALNAMSQSLARYLAPYNVTVGVVAPGFVETDMAADSLEGSQGDAIRAQSPFGRVAYPAEVAYAVAVLAAPQATFLTGTIIDVNGASYLRS
jgi:NAD(P)-dependent dehydrogenase (short-subunit alcohol dehydrogenase family)